MPTETPSSTSEPLNRPILVTGASGQLGRATMAELLRLGATQVIAATSKPDKSPHLQTRGVEVREADFDRPETLRPAFAGVERLVLISTAELAVPGKRLAQHRAAVAAAAASGVQHVVYTSAPSPYPTKESSLNDDHFWTEAALAAAPFTWTVLRNHLYQELLLMAAGPATQSGQLFSATGGRGRAYVSREDCARALAAAALHAEGKQILDVTGPEAITQDQLAALLGELSGRQVAHVEVPPAGLHAGLLQAGLPPFLATAFVNFDVAAAQGYHALVTPTVERLTGTKPGSVGEFLRQHLASA